MWSLFPVDFQLLCHTILDLGSGMDRETEGQTDKKVKGKGAYT